MDTIFAVASGPPPAALAIMRISGPEAFAAGAMLAGSLPPARHAGLRELRDQDGELLDRAIVLPFRGPASATGEDIVELHLHGGRAVVAAVLRSLGAMPRLRLAEAGEFTRRALLAGRIDLAEAEGLADLLSAETEQQRRAATAMADGGLSKQVVRWMDEVAALTAVVEARIEFAEEGDFAIFDDPLVVRVQAFEKDLQRVLASPSVDRLRDGFRIVVAGPPNSGKSSLVNAMAGRDVAIVTPIAGTTRDRIEAPVQREDLPFVLVDTAGLGDTDDPVERIGVDLAKDAIKAADLVLWTGADHPPVERAIWLQTKADLPRGGVGQEHAVSIKDGTSVERLWNAVAGRVSALVPPSNGIIYTERQRETLLAIAGSFSDLSFDDDLVVAEILRSAGKRLATILGIDATAAMLDSLFARFCVGK